MNFTYMVTFWEKITIFTTINVGFWKQFIFNSSNDLVRRDRYHLVNFSRSGKNLALATMAPGSDEIPIRNSVPMLGAQLGSQFQLFSMTMLLADDWMFVLPCLCQNVPVAV